MTSDVAVLLICFLWLTIGMRFGLLDSRGFFWVWWFALVCAGGFVLCWLAWVGELGVGLLCLCSYALVSWVARYRF